MNQSYPVGQAARNVSRPAPMLPPRRRRRSGAVAGRLDRRRSAVPSSEALAKNRSDDRPAVSGRQRSGSATPGPAAVPRRRQPRRRREAPPYGADGRPRGRLTGSLRQEGGAVGGSSGDRRGAN